MNNSDILRKYIGLQNGIMFDELIKFDSATICFCKNDSSPFWNNAVVDSVLTDEQIVNIETKLRDLKRTPAFYFEENQGLKDFFEKLMSLGYLVDADDCMMIYNGNEIDGSRFENVKKVNNQADLEIFLETFDKCYQADDPMNPYGELGEYLIAAREVWLKHNDSGRLEYFIVYENDTPVAVSSLTNFEGMGYISNVGSLTSMRGKGYGKLATMYCVQKSKDNANDFTCLLTEEGTNPNTFYKSLGFETKFNAKLMVKVEKEGK